MRAFGVFRIDGGSRKSAPFFRTLGTPPMLQIVQGGFGGLGFGNKESLGFGVVGQGDIWLLAKASVTGNQQCDQKA